MTVTASGAMVKGGITSEFMVKYKWPRGARTPGTVRPTYHGGESFCILTQTPLCFTPKHIFPISPTKSPAGKVCLKAVKQHCFERTNVMSKRRNWTPAEDAILKAHYADTPMAELLHMLPRRSAHGIRHRAHRLGVQKDYKKPFYDSEWLRHQYVALEKTTTEIGNEVGAHKDTILYWLREHGIPRRQAGYRLRMRPEKVAKLRRLYHEERRSSREIASKLGLSKDTILYRMDKAGLSRRTRLEAAPKGEEHPSWKGGRYVTEQGYVKVKRPDHHRADSNGYVLEHILVMEEKIGRSVKRQEHVHHINEDPADNRPENLMLFASNSEHQKWHWNHGTRRHRRLAQ